MRRRSCTSARRGTLTSSSVSSVRRLAIIRGRAAFFAPEIGITPLSGAPPRITIRSIPKAPCAGWSRPNRVPLVFGRIALIRGGLRRPGSVVPAITRLRLAALQVLPECRLEPLGPSGLLRLCHDRAAHDRRHRLTVLGSGLNRRGVPPLPASGERVGVRGSLRK